MSGSSSPLNGGYEAAGGEPAMRLTVRKDLFPSVRIPKLGSTSPDETMLNDEFEDVSCVKLETDFEQSIDDIANQKLQVVNGALPSFSRPRHRKHKQHSRHDMERPTNNGCLPPESKRRKSSPRNSKYRTSQSNSALVYQVKGGKNLNLVSSSECQDVDDEESSDNEASEESESSEDEVLKCSVKLPLVNVPRQSGKPYSHQLSQLSTKKNKSKESSKERRTHTVAPCSGKPRSMLDICCSRSKKKSKKSDCTATYRSQIVGTKSKIKIKIRRTSVHQTITPTPTSIADLGQRKSKKKRAASPVPSESSGEEYDPSRGDTAAAMSVAAPKPRHQPTRTRKTNKSKSKEKSEKTERTRVSATENKVKETGPQSPWGFSMPEEILTKIFDNVVTSQGALPTLVRLGRVCKLWHSVSCRPELWRNVDLAQHTIEKCKTDYKLVWLLENRLSQCQTLNIAQWKVCNVTWVLACVAEYCTNLVELSVAGWSRLTPEQLFDLVQGLPKLQRLDLSLTSETGGSSTCLSATSVARVVENFGSRLTHLTLANNKFTALPQILASIAAHCPRLEVLDISGALATSHPAAVPLEALQRGCPRMRVFRAANAQLVLAAASQRADCPGWEALEELSVAGEAAAERACVGEYRLGDDALARLVRGATRLRLLDLRGLQRLSDSGLVRVPAWDLHHLFLGGCNVLRQSNACLELICEKWSHSLVELDLSWASATRVLDDAVRALADSATSKLRILNLCGSSVSLEPVKKVLLKCPHIESINLSSCRALPRGMKRLYTGKELQDLKDSLDPQKMKAKEEDSESDSEKKKDTKKSNTTKTDTSRSPKSGPSDTSENKSKAEDDSSLPLRDMRSESESSTNVRDRHKSSETPPDTKMIESSFDKESVDNTTSLQEGNYTTRNTTSRLLSPSVSRPDSSSTPRSEPAKMDIGSPHFSPVTKPDSQIQNSPEVLSESLKSSNSWNLGQFKTTPTHKSEASPLNRSDCHTKMKISKTIEQCSPTTSVDNRPSPEAGSKQDVKSSSSWNYGNYSPMTRQENQFPSQRSPYSAQPSPAQPQPSPYSAQPSPYSTQPSPYSSQPSPYSAQPSPDTSQMVKPDIQKSTAWNTGNYSPMPKHHAPFSPLPSTHPSPDPGLAKSEAIRSTPNRTSGQYSPMSRQDRLHQSPYSPRASADMAYGNKRSPGVGGYSPLMRTDCHLPSSDANSARSLGRTQDAFGRPVKIPELMTSVPQTDPSNASWRVDRYNQIAMDALGWGGPPFVTEQPAPRLAGAEHVSGVLNTPPPKRWGTLPPLEGTARKPSEELGDPWGIGQFRLEPPTAHSFVEQAVSFESLSGGSSHFLDEPFAGAHRAD